MRSSDRLLDVVESLSTSQSCTLSALSAKLDLSKPTVLRFLHSLEERGWVTKLPDGYTLGPQFVVQAHRAIGEDAILRSAPLLMMELRDELDETVSLLGVSGTSRICAIEYPSSKPLRYVHDVGVRAPLHAGASGKVLLAFGSAELRRQVLAGPLERFTPRTLTEVGHLVSELHKVRRAGWALSRGERSAGSVALAVPLREPHTGRIYSLTVFAPEARYHAPDRVRWIGRLAATSRAITAAAEGPAKEAGQGVDGDG
jgi:IclR family transcriptional regulator, acetate operon repressor